MYVCNYLLLFYVTIGTTDGYCAEFTLFMFLLLTFVLTFFVISAALQIRVKLNAFFENKTFNQ